MSSRLVLISLLFITSNAFAETVKRVPVGIECKIDNPNVEGDLFVIRLEKGANPDNPNFYVLSKIQEVYVGAPNDPVPETENIAFQLTCNQSGLAAHCKEISTSAEVKIRSGLLREMVEKNGRDRVVNSYSVLIDVDQFSDPLFHWEFNQSKNQCKVLYK